MEKNLVLAIALTIGLYVAYFAWFAPKAPPPGQQQPAVRPVAQGTIAPAQGTAAPPRPPDSEPATANPELPDLRIGNGSVELTVASKGASLKAAEAWGCVYHQKDDRSVPGDPGVSTAWVDGMPGALAVHLSSGTTALPDATTSQWVLVSSAKDSAVWRLELGGVTLTKTLRCSSDPAHPWHVDVEFEVRNDSAKAGSTWTLETVGPVLPHPPHAAPAGDDGVLLVPWQESGELKHLTAAEIHKKLAESAAYEERSPTGRWAAIGVRADFYLGALIPEGELPADTSVGFRTGSIRDASGNLVPIAAPTFRMPLVVPPVGESVKQAFRMYVGPNQRSLLQEEGSPYRVLRGAPINRTIFGISLTWISQFLAWLLRVLESTGMGYGLAVIALTILVRGSLFPLSRKSQISMRVYSQKMQRLKPKMEAIKTKYKDPKKQQEATMKLMREEKISPLPGGCLLAFLQMPIWIALYGVLQSTFEMRHASFLWVQDLTSPDHLLHLPFWPGWLNLLPLLMMATWYTSAAMQPLPDDPQQAQTAKMMRWMPVVMGFMLYGTAAGLTLYMTMSAIWSIGESWLIKKVWISKLAKP